VVGDVDGAHRLVNMIELFDDGSIPEIEKLTSDLKRTISEEGG
jgi:hypothetical protein